MKYYREKKEIYNTIKKALISVKKIDRNTLYLEVTEKYGFGKKIVNDYLNLLLVSGYIKITDDIIIWLEKEKKK